MALQIPKVNLDRLIQQQAKFIQGIQPFSVQSSTVPLTSAFRPNLDQALNTGFRANTGRAEDAARSEADRLFTQLASGIDERLAAKGLTGSSAQTAQLSRAAGDVSTRLGEQLARLALQADENAANRRVQSLDAALGEASVANATRGLDLQQAGLELQGRRGQASAGQDLISALLRGLPFQQQASAAVRVPFVAPVRRSGLGVRLPGTGSVGRDQAVNLGALFRPTGLSPVDFGIGTPQAAESFNRFLDFRNQDRLRGLADIVGPAGAAQLAAAGTAGTANVLGGLQQGAAQQGNTLLQQRFLSSILSKFGPGFLGGIG